MVMSVRDIIWSVERTVFSLPASLHQRIQARASERGVSMAAYIRESLELALQGSGDGRIAEPGAVYSADLVTLEEEGAMKRIVISLEDELREQVRVMSAGRGVSMAAFIRHTLEERTRRERPKPRFGAFASNYTDTGRLAGEMPYEPRSWR